MERTYAPIGYEPEDYVPEPASAPATEPVLPEPAEATSPAPVEPSSTPASAEPVTAEPAPAAPAQPSKPAAPQGAQPAHKYTPIGYAPEPAVAPIGSGTAITRRLIGSSIDVARNFEDAFEAFGALRDPKAKVDFTPHDPTGYEPKIASVADVDWTSPNSIMTWMGEQLGAAVPQMAPSIAAGGAGGVIGGAAGTPAGPGGVLAGAWVGRTLGAAGMSYVQNFGDVWSGFKDDPGIRKMLESGKVTPQQLARYAAGTAVLVAGLDVASLGKLTGQFKKAGTAEVRKWAIGQVAKRLASGAATEGAAEWAQSLIAQAAEIKIGGNWDLPNRALRSLDEFFGGAFGGGPTEVVAGHPGGHEAPPKPDDQPGVATETQPEGTPAATTPEGGQATPGGGTQAPPPAGTSKQPAAPSPPAEMPSTDPRAPEKPPGPATPDTVATPQPATGVEDPDLGVALPGAEPAEPVAPEDEGVEEPAIPEPEEEEVTAEAVPEDAAAQADFMKGFLGAQTTQPDQDVTLALGVSTPAKTPGIPEVTEQVTGTVAGQAAPQVAAQPTPPVVAPPQTPVAAPTDVAANLTPSAPQEQAGAPVVSQEPTEATQEPVPAPAQPAPAPIEPAPQQAAAENVPAYTPVGYEPEDFTPTPAEAVAPEQQAVTPTAEPVESVPPELAPAQPTPPTIAPTAAPVAEAVPKAPSPEPPKEKITLKGVTATPEELAAKAAAKKPKLGKKFPGREIGPGIAAETKAEALPTKLKPKAPTKPPDQSGLTKAQKELQEEVHKNLPPELENHPFASEAVREAVKEDKAPVRPREAAQRQAQVQKAVASATRHAERLAQEDKARAQAAEDADLKRAQELKRQRETQGTGQEKKRRGKTKGKAAEDVAIQSDKRRAEDLERERAKPAEEQDPDLITYGKYRDARNKLPARDAKRKTYNDLMEEAWQRYVDNLKAKEEPKPATPQPPAPTPAAPLPTPEEQAKAEREARAKTAAERREKSAPALKPLIQEFKLPEETKPGPKGQIPKSLGEYGRELHQALKTFARQANAALQAAGLTPQENITEFQSPEEVLAIFANRLAKSSKNGGLDAVEFASAVTLYNAGNYAELAKIASPGITMSGAGAYVDSTHGRKQGAMPLPDVESAIDAKVGAQAEAQAEAPLPVVPGIPPEWQINPTPQGPIAPDWFLSPTPQGPWAPSWVLNPQVQGPENRPKPKKLQPVTYNVQDLPRGAPKQTIEVTPLATMTGKQLLGYVADDTMASMGAGPFRLIRKMHLRALRKMVPNVVVHVVSDADALKITGKSNVPGWYSSVGPAGGKLEVRFTGKGVPTITLAERCFHKGNQLDLNQVIIHEMTHAAADYALDRDIRGTHQILRHMLDTLVKDLKRGGLYDQLPFEIRYAMSNEWEFLNEAFSNPTVQDFLMQVKAPPRVAGVIGKSLAGQAEPRWWHAFVKAIANAMGIHLPIGESYLDQIIRLHPLVMMTSEEQTAHLQAFGNRRAPPVLGARPFADTDLNGPADVRHLQSVNQAYDAVKQGVADKWANANARTIKSNLATTYELIRRSAAYFGGTEDNPFSRLAKLLLSARSLRNKLAKPGLQLVRDQLWFKAKNRKEYTELSDIGHESTLLGVDPRISLAENIRLKNITKAGLLDEHKRTEFPKLKARYDALSPEARDIFDRTADHHTKQENDRRTQFTSNALKQAVDHYKITLPKSHDQTVADIMGGLLDTDPALMTDPVKQADAIALRKALGKHADTLAGAGVLKKIKGVYFPLMRFGRYVISATNKVTAPPGGVIDPKNPNQILFKSEADYKAYAKANNDQIDRVVSEYYDPVTGKKTQKKASVQHTPGGPLTNPIRVFRVHVMNRVVEMDDNENGLRRRREALIKAGFEVSQVAETEHAFHSKSDLLPTHIKRLMNAMDTSAVGGATVGKQANMNALVDAYIRTQMGSRAQHRRLKRQGVQGFAKDLAEATNSANHQMAGHIANLTMAPQFADAEKALDAHLEQSFKDYGKSSKTHLEQQAMVKELRGRITNMQTKKQDHFGSSALRNVLDMSFLIHLASPAYTIVNLMQPLVTTAPILAQKFGIGRMIKHMTMANYDMGAVRTVGRGVYETGREAALAWRKMPIEQFDHHQWALNRVQQVEPDALGAVQMLEDRGLSASSGIEAPEVSEMGKGFVSKYVIGRTVRIARAAPEAAEAVNRYTTLLAAWRAARESGMTIDQANEFAVSTVEQTQGGYASENNPNFMNNPFLKLPTQFKKYSLMYGQLYYGAMMRMLGPNSTREERVAAAKQTAYLSAMTIAFAGVGGLPFMELGRAFVLVAAMLPGDDEPWKWEDWENGMETWFKGAVKWAMGDYANITAEAIMHGATRLLGIDTSSRMGNESMIMFGEPKKFESTDVKAWLFDMLGGAAVSSIAEAVKARNAIFDGDLSKAPLPKVFTDIIKATQKAKHGTVTSTGRKVGKNFNTGEAIAQGLGFQPRKAVRSYEAGGSGTKHQMDERLKRERTSVMADWAAKPSYLRNQFWLTKVAAWNRKHPDKKITRESLQKSLNRRKQQEKEDKAARAVNN